MKASIIAMLSAVTLGLTLLGVLNYGYSSEVITHNLNQEVQPNSNYNIELSRKYAAYTKATYCPHDLVQNWTCKDCQTYNKVSDIHLIENTKRDIFAYAFYDTEEKKIILAWRGTIDFKNTVLDLEYLKIPYTCTRCEVHRGFYEAFRAVAKEVNEAIQTLYKKYPDAHVMTTGHSLGAALSN
jgi:hypothetical protein